MTAPAFDEPEDDGLESRIREANERYEASRVIYPDDPEFDALDADAAC